MISSLTPCVLAGTLWLGWTGLAGPAGDREAAGRRPRFRKPGVLTDSRIKESSGLARSYRNPGAFWTHNDAGGKPRLFLLGPDAATLATIRVRDAKVVDWEDIASFQRADRSYLLIADVGDNDRQRSAGHDPCTLYLVEEPRLGGEGSQPAGAVDRVSSEETLSFTYEDGPRDCESVAVDASGGRVYLASKEKRHSPCRVYELPLPSAGIGQLAVARGVAELRIGTAVAMDISPDGRRAIVLVKRGHTAFEFVRDSGQSWAAALARPPLEIELPKRRQGEAICYGHDGRTLYLTSEGRKRPLWEVLR